MELPDRKKLARLMTVNDVSQRQVCDAAGWASRGTLIALLNGTKKTIDERRAVRIARFLDVPLESLFDGKSSTIPDQVDQPDGRVA